MVFDVESVGLFGSPFAVGWCVLDTSNGKISDKGYLACPPWTVADEDSNNSMEWVSKNVLPHLPHPTWACLQSVCSGFDHVWRKWSKDGTLLAADVPWPVEARFLSTMIEFRFRSEVDVAAIYPLIDIASVRLAAGFDPIGTFDRIFEGEIPQHHPTKDARHSARLLWEALDQMPVAPLTAKITWSLANQAVVAAARRLALGTTSQYSRSCHCAGSTTRR